jgi:hypothetical protein
MDRQQRVMQRIASLKAGGHANLTSRQISKQLRKLYDPRVFSGLRFHTQDVDGCPLVRTETKIDGETRDCTVAFMNEISLADWKSLNKPRTIKGLPWPPKGLADLLGCKSTGDICVQCASQEQRILIGEEYIDWAAAMYNFWLDNIRLCDIPEVNGYGLRARNAIAKDTVMGEYSGKLIPPDETLSEKETQYHCDIDIGPPGTGDNAGVVGWINATTKGSIFRFMNHSCNANAEMKQGRCGLHHRIMYVYTLRDIKQDQEITIDYGERWWENEDGPCYCGSKNCIKPPTDAKENKKAQGQAKNEKKGQAQVIKRGTTTKNKQTMEMSTAILTETRASPKKEQVPPPRQNSPTKRPSRRRPTVPDDPDDERVIPRKKRRLSRDSDDQNDNPREKERLSHNSDNEDRDPKEIERPTRRKPIVLDTDDEEDIPKKRKRISRDSDDEDDIAKTKKRPNYRRPIVPDDSDDEDYTVKKKRRPRNVRNSNVKAKEKARV